MQSTHFAILDLDSTLQDLPGFDMSVRPEVEGSAVLDIFNRHPELPGLIIEQNQQLAGFISRRTFFEHTGKMYGTEVYLKRPIQFLLQKDIPAPLVLPCQTRISRAVQFLLARSEMEIYEPVVEESPADKRRIIHSMALFTAQNQILIHLHNQRLAQLSQPQPLEDDLAIRKFLKFAGFPEVSDLDRFKTSYTVLCPRCKQKISYSIADIVRAFPTLQQGIEIADRMGTRMYTFYIRHTCGSDILDVPVQHDHNLDYRSVKTPRLVETYA